MKNNAAYRHGAILSVLMTFCDMNHFSNKVSEIMSNDMGISVDVYSSKADGFILRKRKDDIITETQVREACCKATKEIIKEEDGFESYLSDRYDVEYDKKDIDNGFAELFDVKSKGRLLHIEIDI